MYPIETRLETVIGVASVITSQVQFHVESYGFNTKEGQAISYDNRFLNVGDGFIGNNQWFEAPYSGTYFFSISGTKGQSYKKMRACIDVKINNNVFGSAISSDYTNFGGFSYQFTKKLNAGDKIELFMKFGDVYILAFTGWMLDENLAL